MASTMETPGSAATDRLFYTGMAVAFAVITFVGFAPTFFLRPAELAPLSALRVVHGVVFTAWIVLLVVQTGLVAAGRRDLHRALGAFGVALACAMLVLGVAAAVDSLRQGSAPVPGLDARSFFAIPMRVMFIFPVFVAAGVWYRRDAQMHKRMMLLATIAILDAAIARAPIPGMLTYGPLLLYALQDLLIVVGILYDAVSRGRVHRAWWWGLALMVGSQVLTLALARTPLWLGFADLFL